MSLPQVTGDGGNCTRAPWLQGKALSEPRGSRKGSGMFSGTRPNSCREAKPQTAGTHKREIQSTSWPSGKTDVTKTQQGYGALHPHRIRFLNKEYVSLRCQVSGQNCLKCFETAVENWTYPKQNHPSPQMLAPGYLFVIIDHSIVFSSYSKTDNLVPLWSCTQEKGSNTFSTNTFF